MPSRTSTVMEMEPTRSLEDSCPKEASSSSCSSSSPSWRVSGVSGRSFRLSRCRWCPAPLQSLQLLMAVYWALFAAIVTAAYLYASDGEFSAMLTLSSAFFLQGLIFLAFKTFIQRTIQGVSLGTLYLYGLAAASRLTSNLMSVGYLPADRSGDYIYRGLDAVVVVVSVVLVVRARCLHETPTAKRPAVALPAVVLVLIAAAAAAAVHPSLTQDFCTDFAWTFALYLETLAMLPQLVLLTKGCAGVEALTGHYIVSCFISRVCALYFWANLEAVEFSPEAEVDAALERGVPEEVFLHWNISAWVIIVAHVIQVLLLADFSFLYVRAKWTCGKSMPKGFSELVNSKDHAQLDTIA